MFGKRYFPVFIFLFLAFSQTLKAQPLLPDILGATDKGINVISWNCQYDGIKSIAVQRSSDSVYNFSTVGYVKNLKKGPQAFIDGHPMPGNNWYKLYIAFNSDLTWYSNRFKIYVDSASILKGAVLPPNDSLQKLASRIKVDTSSSQIVIKKPVNGNAIKKPVNGNAKDSVEVVNKIKLNIPDPSDIDAYSYIKSQYVFTNPFTGHVTMELPDIHKYYYSIRFFDMNNRKIMDIPHVTESPIIIDKRNFPRKGLFKFELKRGNEKLEGGYITIY